MTFKIHFSCFKPFSVSIPQIEHMTPTIPNEANQK